MTQTIISEAGSKMQRLKRKDVRARPYYHALCRASHQQPLSSGPQVMVNTSILAWSTHPGQWGQRKLCTNICKQLISCQPMDEVIRSTAFKSTQCTHAQPQQQLSTHDAFEVQHSVYTFIELAEMRRPGFADCIYISAVH